MRRDHQAPPVPLTPAVWAELIRRHAPRVRGLILPNPGDDPADGHAPRVRGLILAGKPHVIITIPPRREA